MYQIFFLSFPFLFLFPLYIFHFRLLFLLGFGDRVLGLKTVYSPYIYLNPIYLNNSLYFCIYTHIVIITRYEISIDFLFFFFYFLFPQSINRCFFVVFVFVSLIFTSSLFHYTVKLVFSSKQNHHFQQLCFKSN